MPGWKKLIKTKIYENEKRQWFQYCHDHPRMQFAKICLENVSPHYFWSIARQYIDLINRLHAQATSMCNFGVNGGVSCLFGTNRASFFTCKNEVEKITRLLFLRPSYHENFENIWSNLETEILNNSATGETDISNYINKATITQCDLWPRFFCVDDTLLCECESDKI